MIRKNYTAFFILWAAFLVFLAGAARAQNGSVAAPESKITAAQMPRGAERLLPESVPAEFNRAFDQLLEQGAGKIAGGEREVLAWTGNYKTPASVAKSVSQVEANFRNAGWKYEAFGRSGDLELFSLSKDGAARRVVLGFFVPGDDVLVCALMEVKLPGEKPTTQNEIDRPGQNNSFPVKSDASAKVVTVDKDAQSVNVMGTEMPAIPQFAALTPKPGKVRGYVKDWTGKPLAGAELGVRSSYLAGYYSGAQGKTDANGYYEFVVPKGSAHFYNAGYQIEWGDGVAAVSLHPADGKLDSFVTMDGAVENFVLLPYGITSRENLQENSHLPSTFYGGAIFLNWYSVEADDNNAPPFAVRAGALLEITLAPEGKMFDGSAGQTIVIRKTLGISGAFRIHNIPLGRYRMTIKANGKPLKIKDNKGYDQMFGMTPAQALGTASILFVPDSAKATMVGPQHGAWKWIGLGIETP
ncbi:MAG TPA: hypothetical protein VIL74_04010 [Pyrinomonadaceae bacterium]|jgi:hypothetical protein